MKNFGELSPPQVQKDSKPPPGPTPSKRQSILDTFLNFGKPNYAPLTPIEILPGIMSTDGVATVFQLDTRKPKTVKQAAKMEAKKRSASTTTAAGQARAGQREEWQDALRPQDGYFGSSSSSGSGKGSKKDPNRPSMRKSLLRTFKDDGIDVFSYGQAHNLKGSKRKDEGKEEKQYGSGALLYPDSKPGLSPTDKLTVRHANPFTGLLSRNQTELNVSRTLPNAKMSGGLPPSPPYPHSRYRYPPVSSPNLLSSSTTALEDLVPMPSVHEPAPFSFPGATAEEIDAYERAVEAATTNVANHLAVPTSRKHRAGHQCENTRNAGKKEQEHFLVPDGGPEQQWEQEWRTKHKMARSSTQTSSLQDRHLQIPKLRKVTTPSQLPTVIYPMYEGPAPPESMLRSVSNMDQRAHRKRRERHTSTSMFTTKGKGGTHLPPLEDGENIPHHPRPQTEKLKASNPKTREGTGVVASTGMRGKGEKVKPPRRTGSGPGLALFDGSVPFIDARQLAEYRRARAGLPPLREREGVFTRIDEMRYKTSFPFRFQIEDPSSASVSESECECERERQKLADYALTMNNSGRPLKTIEEQNVGQAKKPAKTEYNLKALLDALSGFLKAALASSVVDLSVPPAIQEAIQMVKTFLEPVLTLNAPPQFWQLPILLRILLGMWYLVIVTWGVLVVVRVVRIVGEVVGVIMVPVRGVVWVARIICGG